MKAQIWNERRWIPETREKVLDAMLDELVQEAGFSVLGTMEHEFSPYGYTKIYLLGESHLALHTFPEEGKSYIELSSCNEQKHHVFVNALLDRLNKEGG